MGEYDGDVNNGVNDGIGHLKCRHRGIDKETAIISSKNSFKEQKRC